VCSTPLILLNNDAPQILRRREVLVFIDFAVDDIKMMQCSHQWGKICKIKVGVEMVVFPKGPSWAESFNVTDRDTQTLQNIRLEEICAGFCWKSRSRQICGSAGP
jgi:hypothetical protein